MTVSELIDKLTELPQNLEVFQNIGDGLYSINEVDIVISTGILKDLVGYEFVLI